MKEKAEKLKSTFESLSFKSPDIPIVSNYSARPLTDVTSLKEALIKQTYSTVRWYEGINFMISNDVTDFIEIGHGSTLANMLKRMQFNKNFTTLSISNVNDIESYIQE